MKEWTIFWLKNSPTAAEHYIGIEITTDKQTACVVT